LTKPVSEYEFSIGHALALNERLRSPRLSISN
jgi:hypothetical protein